MKIVGEGVIALACTQHFKFWDKHPFFLIYTYRGLKVVMGFVIAARYTATAIIIIIIIIISVSSSSSSSSSTSGSGACCVQCTASPGAAITKALNA